MRRHLVWLAGAMALLPAVAAAETSSSWIFRPSYFSHAPDTCERVTQYRPEEPAYAPCDATYQQSGFRYIHSALRSGGSEDHVHIVETWGAGESIRPYGEWEFPFRAGATPYGPWGNPQGPWTLPMDSWQNPYGLRRLQALAPQQQFGPQQQLGRQQQFGLRDRGALGPQGSGQGPRHGWGGAVPPPPPAPPP